MHQENCPQSESQEVTIQTLPTRPQLADDLQPPQPNTLLPRKTAQTISFQNLHHQSTGSDSQAHLNIENPYQLASSIKQESKYKQFIDLQNKIVEQYPVFPQINITQLQANINPQLLSKTTDQLLFLFNRVQEQFTLSTCHQQLAQLQPISPTSINQTISSRGGPDNSALYRTLHKQDEMIRSLKSENEYLTQQLGILRKDRSRGEQPTLSPQHQMSVFSRQNRSSSQPVPTPPAYQQSLQNEILLSTPAKRIMQNIVDDQELLIVKFDIQQLQEAVRLKVETCKNLQRQIESQKRRFYLDLEGSTQKFEKQINLSRCRIDELSMDVAQKDMMIGELKAQLDQMVHSRAINLNYIVTKPQKAIPELNAPQQNSTLQSIFKIENEMNSLSMEDNYSVKPMYHKKSYQQKQHQDVNLNLQKMLTNQIAAVQIADEMIEEANAVRKTNKTISLFEEQVKRTSEANQKLSQDLKSLKIEKKELKERLQSIRQDNNDIKFKFAQLLENFQDYVSDQELKSKLHRPTQKSEDFQFYLCQQTDTNQILEDDAEIMTSMRRNMQDLERIVKGLQNELLLKEDVFNVLKRENQTLVEMLGKRPQEKVEMNIAEKQVHQLEAQLLHTKEAYEIKLIQQRQYYEDKLDNILNSKADLVGNQELTIGSQNLVNGLKQLRQETVGCSQKTLPSKLNNSSSQCLTYGCARQQQEVDQLRAEILQSEQLVSEKNREIIRLKMVHEDITSRLRSMPSIGNKRQSEQPVNQRRQLIAELTHFVNTFRQGLRKVRASLFSQKDLQVADLDSKISSEPSKDVIPSEEAFTIEFKIQMQELKALCSILNEVELLVNSAQSRNQTQKYPFESTYRAKRNADEMLRQNHSSALHKLLCEKIQQSEMLMQENAHLEKTIKSYEASLSELDSVSKIPKSETELKRLIGTQTKQIIALQRQLQKVQVSEKENMDQFREKDLHHLERQIEGLKQGNDELLAERQHQLILIADLQNQAQISTNQLEEVLTQLMDKSIKLEASEEQSEQILVKLTKIAEIFERKQIEQKYSFDVLTDFIFEKATRLKNKYESASQQLQAMEQEKVYYYERKVDSLDHEVQNLKQVQRFYQKVNNLLIPKFYDLLEKSVPKKDCEEEYSFAILEKSEAQMRSMAKNLQTYQERFTELQGKFDLLADEVTGHPTYDQRPLDHQDVDRKLQTALQMENEEILKSKNQIAQQRIFSPLRQSLLRHSVSQDSNSNK